MNRTLILAGGGHAHLFAVHALLKEKVDFRIILISPSRYQYYSGMFSGFTEGIYGEKDIRIDLKDLCERADITFIQDQVVSFDPTVKKVQCSRGQPVLFDAVSFDIGSVSEIGSSIQDHIIPIRPNYLFTERIENIKRSPKPVVVGGGAAGVELALSMLAWRKNHAEQKNVTLVTSSKLLHSFGVCTSKKIKRIATSKSLHVIKEEKVTDITSSHVHTDKQNSLEHTGVLWLTGANSSDLFEDAGMTTDDSGFLLVNNYLQGEDCPFVFGAGDCVTINKHRSLPKNGVYAVRQAPVLWENIKEYLNGGELNEFIPQKRYVAILSTGNKQALFTYGNFSVHSSLAWKLKHFIDGKFIRKFK
ncbi:FAD-dependent oxidoreductase [Salinicoccus albus]|uniref:FAD-dependent oxidoreductase n=1 Tax=Salinicoccus albus TaxID=418756 RepID=UPI00037E05F0|nr:FAD-dependent oxidoreductase [Salinicoccus albus]